MGNNKVLGNTFEQEVVDALSEMGWWVHFIVPNKAGAQPFDVIAVKNNKAIAVECKTLADNKRKFPITRMEDNQQLALDKWLSCGNTKAMIAVKHRKRIFWLPWQMLKEMGAVDLHDGNPNIKQTVCEQSDQGSAEVV